MKTLGIDLGGTQIKYGLLENSVLIESGRCNTPSDAQYKAVLNKINEIALDFYSRHKDISHMGLAAPGLIDTNAGVIRFSNNLGWSEVPVCKDISDKTGKSVRMANDALCATLGEALYGAGKGFSRVAMLTIGTGVGGGFIRDGQIEADGYGSMAYIFGHSIIEFDGKLCNCGRRGCLETYASASAVAKRGKRAALNEATVQDIFNNARLGDAISEEIVREFLDYLSAGVINIANILRPHIIIIGGGVSSSADLIIPVLKKALKKGVYGFSYAPVLVKQAELGNNAGVVGAASL